MDGWGRGGEYIAVLCILPMGIWLLSSAARQYDGIGLDGCDYLLPLAN